MTAVGNPAFDLIKPWDENTAVKTREILDIRPDSLVVSYFGLPTQDFPNSGHGYLVEKFSAWDSLESFSLQRLILQMIVMAIKFPEDHFTFIYKQHPRNASDMTPVVNIAYPSNLQIVFNPDDFWKTHHVKPSEIAQVSRIVFAVMSTVLDEVAIRNSQSGTVLPLLASFIPEGMGFQPNLMNPDENSVFHRIDFHELPLITNRASVLVENASVLELIIHEVFLGSSDYFKDILRNQNALAGKYLFPHPDATSKIISIFNNYL